MSAPQPPAPQPPAPRRRELNAGRLVVGAFLVLLGAGWLLQSLNVVTFPWRVLLPSALIVVGVALVAVSRSGRGHGGLITLGIVLTVLLTAGTAIDLPLGGGIGERTERPTTSGDHRYELAIGQMTVDLASISYSQGPVLKPQTKITARVGIGELIVLVPRRMLVDVIAKAGVGQSVVFGRERSGIGVESGFHPYVPFGVIPLSIDVSVGLGRVEVRYA